MPRTTGPSSRRALGAYGERLAASHLAELGFRILARNLHLREAELDLVAIEGDTLCFVEVRTRRGAGYGSAEESVDLRKRARLARAAARALAEHRWPRHTSVRFDVVAVDASREPPVLRLIRDAFYVDRR